MCVGGTDTRFGMRHVQSHGCVFIAPYIVPKRNRLTHRRLQVVSPPHTIAFVHDVYPCRKFAIEKMACY